MLFSFNVGHIALQNHTWKLSPGIQMLDTCFGFCLALQDLALSLNTAEAEFPVSISRWNFAMWTV